MNSTQRLIFVHVIAVASTLLTVLFPMNGEFQSALALFTFLVVIPLLSLKIIFQKKLPQYGFTLPTERKIILEASGIFLGALLVYAILILVSPIKPEYLMVEVTAPYAKEFFYHAVFWPGLLLFFFTVFFQAFLMKSWEEKIGLWSLLLSTLLFVLWLVIVDGIEWDIIPFIFFTPFAGFMLLRTQSIFYSFTFGWLFVILVYIFTP